MSRRLKCPFCYPAAQRATFAETAQARAIYNLAPIVPGHSMVVPRVHVSRLLELDPERSAALFELSRQVADLLMKVYRCDGYDLSLQQGESAGQTVDHLHLHIVPRKPGDLSGQGGDWHEQVLDSASRPRLTPEQMAETVLGLRKALREGGLNSIK